ncbi:DNA repair protein RecO [Patescibacteria group bacterium]|nr:DNA repair protein RecO [Patescibacteria group bacterium]
MSYIRDQVVILKKTPYRENDRRYIMYGMENGLMIAVGRGALKSQAKQASQLEPLSIAEVMIAKGRAYDHLAVAKQVKSGSYNFLASYAVAGALSDLTLRLLRTGVADKRIFLLWEEVINYFKIIPTEPTAVRSSLLFAATGIRLLDILGYGPHFGNCLSCKLPIGPTHAYYAPDSNGLVCSECRGRWPEQVMHANAYAINFINYIRSSNLESVASVTASVEVIQNCISLIRESCKHAPLDREPHGFSTVPDLA